jgi:voltage-gated potassium channel
MKVSIRGVNKFFSALLRRLIKQRAPTVSEEQAGEDFVIPVDTRVPEETVPSAHRQEKKERKPQKRKRITFLELWEVMNSNNTLTFFLIVVGLLALGAVGAFIFEAGRNQAFGSFWDTIWWTVVTITTVGYGDKFPVTLGGKLVGILIMILGVATIGIVTGRIASFLVNKQIKARGGLIVVERRKGHFIICGWKEGLEIILENILKVNTQLRPSNIVLINDVDPEEIDHIRSIPQFKSIKYIKGDYIDEKVLGRANLKNAGTALVLADSSRNFSVQEVDSRTVMAVITIDSMNKNIYTCAELLDEKFEKYLKLANCDEIILSREHSRILIANAASASGISHIASELLLPTHGGLLTEEIPSMLVGKTFLELQGHYRRMYGDIVIGVLENTGKLYYRKREALAEAQKTPDISKLIENLQGVKRLVPNKPLLNPGDAYVIKKNSRAIIVTGRREGSEEQEEKAANE